MREIVLDTETTGLEVNAGHRLVEIGCVELENYIPTGRVYHQYINPERNMPEKAFEVHGLSEDFLKTKPVFSEVSQAFLDFVKDDVLVIHNAPFDLGFINGELERAGVNPLRTNKIVDTLKVARKKYPGGNNSLDALCRRYEVDNSIRDKHGALLDAELLAEVYVELIEAREPSFDLSPIGSIDKKEKADTSAMLKSQLPNKVLLTLEEEQNHKKFIHEKLGPQAVWLRRMAD